jgi:hypothetical protein
MRASIEEDKDDFHAVVVIRKGMVSGVKSMLLYLCNTFNLA